MDCKARKALINLDAGHVEAIFTSSRDIARWAEESGYTVRYVSSLTGFVDEIWADTATADNGRRQPGHE